MELEFLKKSLDSGLKHAGMPDRGASLEKAVDINLFSGSYPFKVINIHTLLCFP